VVSVQTTRADQAMTEGLFHDAGADGRLGVGAGIASMAVP